jgi:hypothetical protein
MRERIIWILACYLCCFSLSVAEIAHSSEIYAYVPAEEAVELVA